jgi:hypothetical protein
MSARCVPRIKETEMRRTATLVAALTLAVALAGPAMPAGAAGSAGHHLQTATWSLASLWTWLTAGLPWQGMAQATCDRGSQIDPNGLCHS